MTPASTMTTSALGGGYLGGKAATPMATATTATTAAGTPAAGTTPSALGTPSVAPTATAIPTAAPGAPGAAPPAKMGMSDYVNRITGLKNAGQNQQAFQMFNGLSTGQYGAGALDSALRQAWGADAAKQWINEGDQNYHGHGFDPTKDNAALGWQASGFDPNAAKQWQTDWAQAGGADMMNTGAQDAWIKNWASSVGGQGYSPSQYAAQNTMPTGVGVQGDGKTPMSAAPIGNGQGSGLAPGGGYNPGNGQTMPGPSPAPALRPTNTYDQPSQPSSTYSNTRNMGRPLALGGGQVGGGMGRPLRATDV